MIAFLALLGLTHGYQCGEIVPFGIAKYDETGCFGDSTCYTQAVSEGTKEYEMDFTMVADTGLFVSTTNFGNRNLRGNKNDQEERQLQSYCPCSPGNPGYYICLLMCNRRRDLVENSENFFSSIPQQEIINIDMTRFVEIDDKELEDTYANAVLEGMTSDKKDTMEIKVMQYKC